MRSLLRFLRWLVVWPDPRPADAPPRTWFGWFVTMFQALLGQSTWQREDGSTRGPLVWLLRTLQGLVVRVALLLLVLGFTGYLLLRASLPEMDGTRTVAGLTGEVRIERDSLAIPTIQAENRADLFYGLGYVHAQERFFQMDLSRRFAAGELSALLGAATLEADIYTRPLRLRSTVQALLDRLSEEARAELDSYVAGVNAGLANLSMRPPEYLLLQAKPQPWTAQDCGLVLLSIVLTLQDDNWKIERYRAAARATLPDSLYQLLDARGSEWDAPLQGEPFATPRLPTAEEFDLRKQPKRARLLSRLDTEPAIPGSNNWALSGSETRQGRAILANDMHLQLRVPHIWYRAGLAWKSKRDGRAMKAWGVTFPGTPGLVVGSNQLVAWGLTNAEIDTADLVRIERDPGDEQRYRTPDGFEPFQQFDDSIEVRGESPRSFEYAWTRWGPVVQDDPRYALHWIAQSPEGLNFGWLELLEARSLDEAMTAANRTGSPHQNFLVADTSGAIGWTILGAIPKRVGFEGRQPANWAEGARWDGFLQPKDYPRIVKPTNGRLWTANNRVVGEPALSLLGEAGFDRGARAMQIRDALLALEKPDETAVFQIALDDRALFLKRWEGLLTEVLEKAEYDDAELLAWMRREATCSAERAGVECSGYRLVAEFRERVSRAVLEPLVESCRGEAPDFHIGYFRHREGAVWKIVTEGPRHLLSSEYRDWDDLLVRAAKEVAGQVKRTPGGPSDYTWGNKNISRIEHPLSRGVAQVPYLGPWLATRMNMPARPLNGAFSDMPRVQGNQHGASQRMVVSPGHEGDGFFHMPCGQSGHPLSPHYCDMHDDWCNGHPTPFLPGPTVHTLTLKP